MIVCFGNRGSGFGFEGDGVVENAGTSASQRQEVRIPIVDIFRNLLPGHQASREYLSNTWLSHCPGYFYYMKLS